VAAETGIVGLLTFGALIGGAGMGALRARRSLAEAGEAEAEKIATGFGIALLGYLAGSIFLHLTYPRYFWLLLGIGLGMYALAEPMRAPARRIAATPVAQGTG
jgi:hypothetical protein